MNFLIKARWYEAQADQQGITITQSQVLHALRVDKREHFLTAKAWEQWLKQTGQSVSDVIFRFRITLTYDALLEQEHGNQSALEAKVQAAWRPSTECARYYIMDDCGNSSQARRRQTSAHAESSGYGSPKATDVVIDWRNPRRSRSFSTRAADRGVLRRTRSQRFLGKSWRAEAMGRG
jgi:hypothetical protein